MDMSATVAPKSNQLNADDLLAGPRTIVITHVAGTGNAEQPVSVSFEGDDGKPFLPCKSMRRVMIAAWGVDASKYVGRSMTLYRDPKVKWGGMEVGGCRISHMSHIEREMVIALTMTKKERAPYRVKPLVVEKPAPAAEQAGPALIVIKPTGGEYVAPDAATWKEACKRAIAKLEDAAAVARWRADMAPHFLAAEHVDIAAVDHVTGVAQKRMNTLADAGGAER